MVWHWAPNSKFDSNSLLMQNDWHDHKLESGAPARQIMDNGYMASGMRIFVIA